MNKANMIIVLLSHVSMINFIRTTTNITFDDAMTACTKLYKARDLAGLKTISRRHNGNAAKLHFPF